jgi:hypothetical protein
MFHILVFVVVSAAKEVVAVVVGPVVIKMDVIVVVVVVVVVVKVVVEVVVEAVVDVVAVVDMVEVASKYGHLRVGSILATSFIAGSYTFESNWSNCCSRIIFKPALVVVAVVVGTIVVVGNGVKFSKRSKSINKCLFSGLSNMYGGFSPSIASGCSCKIAVVSVG